MTLFRAIKSKKIDNGLFLKVFSPAATLPNSGELIQRYYTKCCKEASLARVKVLTSRGIGANSLDFTSLTPSLKR